MIKIVPYAKTSMSARDLCRGLNGERIFHSGYTQAPDDLIVNWGCSFPRVRLTNLERVLNHPSKVALACCKLAAFKKFTYHDVPCPAWTEDVSVALQWLTEGDWVVVRHTTTGSKGRGIEIVKSGSALPNAPLYTKFIKESTEYRVHVLNGKAFDTVCKRKKDDFPAHQFNPDIRSNANGWSFRRDGIRVPTAIKDAAILAVKALGLDFGAVDCSYADGRPYVYEVNTAPGLLGTTLTNYVQAFSEYERSLNG